MFGTVGDAMRTSIACWFVREECCQLVGVECEDSSGLTPDFDDVVMTSRAKGEWWC